MSRREEDWEELRTTLFIIYGLYAAALLSFGITLLVGGVLVFVKREELMSSPYGEHAEYLLRTLIGAVAGGVVSFVVSWILSSLLSFLAFVGWIVGLAFLLWYVYRVGMGAYSLWQDRPVSPTSWL